MRSASDKYERLICDGYCVFSGVLDPRMLERTRRTSESLLGAQPASHFAEQRSTGSMISVYDDSFFAELVAYPPALDCLAALGFAKPRWSSGFVISKPPDSPPLFWHQDWLYWDDPASYGPTPHQLFLMYYLVDTDRENGCLRLLRGSHRQRHPMHDATPEAHADGLRRNEDPAHPAYQPLADEVVVPVKAGDLVIGDARLLHGAYGNRSAAWRTVVTLWYHPNFESAPETMQAGFSQSPSKQSGSWTREARETAAGLFASYAGTAKPQKRNRIPGAMLTYAIAPRR